MATKPPTSMDLEIPSLGYGSWVPFHLRVLEPPIDLQQSGLVRCLRCSARSINGPMKLAIFGPQSAIHPILGIL